MREFVTIVTGASKGIGRYLAEHYCDAGHQVIGCSRGSATWSHERYRHIAANVADEADVKNVIRIVRKEHGRLDCLLNNAGIASMNHSLLTPVQTVRRIFETNLVGTFLFCREAAKVMRTNKFGRIVNFTTVAVPMRLEGEAAYVASKSAVEGLTGVLSREYAEFGITVNSIGPVPIETDLIKAVPGEKIRQLIERQAIKRTGKFEDVANVADFYLSESSDFITGQCLYLGGVS